MIRYILYMLYTHRDRYYAIYSDCEAHRSAGLRRWHKHTHTRAFEQASDTHTEIALRQCVKAGSNQGYGPPPRALWESVSRVWVYCLAGITLDYDIPWLHVCTREHVCNDPRCCCCCCFLINVSAFRLFRSLSLFFKLMNLAPGE